MNPSAPTNTDPTAAPPEAVVLARASTDGENPVKSPARRARGDKDFHSSVRWSALSKYGAQGVQFIVSIVLARLLAPEYFGLLGMATVVTGFLRTFRNLGFTSAIVQRKEVTQELLSTLFWVNMALCVVVGVVMMAIAPLAGSMYGEPLVTWIIIALTPTLLFTGLMTIPAAMLQREMAFRDLAVREIGGVIVSGATGVVLALAGWGVWALVAASLAGAFAQTVLICWLEPFRPGLVWDSQGLKESLSFGLNITGFRIFNYFARNADNLIIGLFLGPAALGFYALAYRLMLLPRDSVSAVVTRVLFPKLSRSQGDDEQLADKYLRACGAIACLTFPLMTALAILADPFVRVVLGEKWLPAAPLLMILAPIGMLHSIQTTVGQLYLAKGRSGLMFVWGVISSMIFVASFLIGIPWGVKGVACSYAVANLLLLYPCLHIPFGLVRSLSVGRFMRSLLPHAIVIGVMAAAMHVVTVVMDQAGIDGALPILLVSILVGSVTYVAIVVVVRPVGFTDVVSALSPMRYSLLGVGSDSKVASGK
ncbi:Teichuronic acid biosynthesis protein TuaB [Pseudobythopirellula maris]|uniref:Teichuronic acid biosynthesis protein TuaB n=1 Tax=Pseudobythopirellula maris TaxID=2527991 RepID=A0A5C5ZQC6_9BACT|nr:MOP flippase family protein [Pseudobythopirellula maris]TWT89732.1 Teichuronic acid biosynthesis protein TuaB [Pseudobythopirellula maris]